jgi:hypothetical protein
MEYRMYGLVARSLSDMQKAIQFGHAVVEYELLSRDTEFRSMYNDWAVNSKTFIILNGGSTNTHSHIDRGTLQESLELLEINGVKTAVFHEPDVNDAMTAVVFLVDERVWDKVKYPDYIPLDDWADFDVKWAHQLEWVKSIGGRTNEFLRDFLIKFKLA